MSGGSSAEHRARAAGRVVRIGLVTVSDTRTPETDANGRWLRERIVEAGHLVAGHRIVPDEPAAIRAVLDELCGDAGVVVCNGGTGIAPRDTTFDVISALLEKTLPGFGELFRMLSYEQVGAAAMLSRAVAGLYRGSVVASLPGSEAAVRLAWTKLLAPELEHLAWEIARPA